VRALLIPLAFVIVLVAAAASAALVGAGPTALLAGIVGVLCVLAMFGGTLRQDIRFSAVFGPAMVLVVAGPRLLQPVWAPGAIGAVVIIVFLAGVLPVLGGRYGPVTLAVGLGAVFGYAYPFLGHASGPQIIAAPVVAVAVAVVIRVCAGAVDPDLPLRSVLADLFIGTSSIGDAVDMTSANASQTWLRDVLLAGIRYRAADAAIRLEPDDQAPGRGGRTARQVDTRADAVSGLIRSRRPARTLPEAPSPLTDSWSTIRSNALEAAAVAATERNGTPAARPALWNAHRWAESAALLRWSSPQLRHAVRSALAMLAVLLVALAIPGDPLVVTLLAVTLGISQPLWRDTVSKTGQRLLGVLIGVVLLALIVWLSPPGWLFGIGIAALIVGLIFISSRPVVYYAASVLLGVGTKSNESGFDPVEMLIEYPVLILIAAIIGMTIGLFAVPWIRPDSAASQLRHAADATRTFLLTAIGRPVDDRARPPSIMTDYMSAVALTDALARLGPVASSAERAAEGLRGLLAIGALAAFDSQDEQPKRSLLGAAEELRDPESPASPAAGPPDDDFRSRTVSACLVLVHDAARAYSDEAIGRQDHTLS
jgi:uncharacterized membrane protein YccC